MIEITKNNFETEIEKSQVPVLVDFFASWCGPCKMMASIMDELDSEAKDYKIAKVNVDKERELSEKFGIEFLPTVIIFKNGKIVQKVVGFRAKEELISLLTEKNI